MTFGVKTNKIKGIEKKIFIQFHAEGDEVDQYDLIAILQEALPNSKITHAEVKLYYTDDRSDNLSKSRNSKDDEQSSSK